MKQYRITAPTYENLDIPDAVMDHNDIADLQHLAGVPKMHHTPKFETHTGSNISVTGNEKATLMKQHAIKPGTPEWFQLWFSRPYLTNEPPVGK
jgi:hypothetical protein